MCTRSEPANKRTGERWSQGVKWTDDGSARAAAPCVGALCQYKWTTIVRPCSPSRNGQPASHCIVWGWWDWTGLDVSDVDACGLRRIAINYRVITAMKPTWLTIWKSDPLAFRMPNYYDGCQMDCDDATGTKRGGWSHWKWKWFDFPAIIKEMFDPQRTWPPPKYRPLGTAGHRSLNESATTDNNRKSVQATTTTAAGWGW